MKGHKARKPRSLFEITGSVTVNPLSRAGGFTISLRQEAESVPEAFDALKRLYEDLKQEIWNQNDPREE
jgi:hypothetical protein